MKLTAIALSKVNKPNVRRELAGMLHCTEQSIIRYIHKNEENGPLTLLAVLELLENLTGLVIGDLIGRKKEGTLSNQ